MPSAVHDRILSTAERLFYAEGTRVVGIDRLIEETPVAKATLYRYFPSKDALIESYLRARHNRLVESLHEAEATYDGSSRQKILHLFDCLAEKASQPDFRGCAFLKAVAENESQPAVITIAREHKAEIKLVFERLASDFASDFQTLGEELALCYEGALATISVARNPTGALTARRIAERMIGADISHSK